MYIGSLWYWQDISIELRRGRGPRARQILTRIWRLLASALCLLEASVLSRALWVVLNFYPSSHMLVHSWPAALSPPIAMAANNLLSPNSAGALRPVIGGAVSAGCLGTACIGKPAASVEAILATVSLPKLVSLLAVLARPLQAAIISVGTCCRPSSVIARSAAAAYFLYLTWWHAFPAEALTRRYWRPSLLPDRPPVGSLGTWLMHLLCISAKPWGGDELIQRTSVSASPARPLTPSDAKLRHPFPSFFSRQAIPEEDYKATSVEARVGTRESVGEIGLLMPRVTPR